MELMVVITRKTASKVAPYPPRVLPKQWNSRNKLILEVKTPHLLVPDPKPSALLFSGSSEEWLELGST
jgi:hypothetical protein